MSSPCRLVNIVQLLWLFNVLMAGKSRRIYVKQMKPLKQANNQNSFIVSAGSPISSFICYWHKA